MAESSSKTVAICIGATKYDDKKLPGLPSAADSARAFADALDRSKVGTVNTLIDPGRSDDVFVALSKTIKEAKRGSLLIYFAGNVLRRDNELLLAAGETEVDPPAGTVPLSDIEDLLLRELVNDALIVLNVHQGPGGAVSPKVTRGGVSVVGFAFPNDDGGADAKIKSGGAALTDALRAAASKLAPSLSDGMLDGEALARELKRSGPGNTVHVANGSKLVLRDLRDELARAEEAAKVPTPAEAPAPPSTAAKEEPAPTTAVKEEAAPAEKPASEPKAEPAAKAKPKSVPPAAKTPPRTEQPSTPAPRAETPALQTNFRIADLWLYALIVFGILGGASYFMLGQFVRELLRH